MCSKDCIGGDSLLGTGDETGRGCSFLELTVKSLNEDQAEKLHGLPSVAKHSISSCAATSRSSRGWTIARGNGKAREELKELLVCLLEGESSGIFLSLNIVLCFGEVYFDSGDGSTRL